MDSRGRPPSQRKVKALMQATHKKVTARFTMLPAGRRCIASALAALAAWQVTACANEAPATPVAARANTTPVIRDSLRLADDTFNILAKPLLASRDRTGRIYIADVSDKNIKVYDATGARVSDIGRAGVRPGEFTQLASAQVFGDHLMAYSFQQGLMSEFTSSGKFLRATTLKPAPFDLRIVDDSLLLEISHPGDGGPLLAIARADGRVLARFFAPRQFNVFPELRFMSGIIADAHNGFIYAGVFGSDTLHVFNYAGKNVATLQIPSRVALGQMDVLFARNGGAVRRADSTWFHDGMQALMRLVALDSGRVALQLAKYDGRVGNNLLNGSEEILVLRMNGSNATSVVDRLPARGMILGRDSDGGLLVAEHAPDNQAQLLILHKTFR
ncbi:MAG: 6-bladed beta-propeller [Gemmatimonadetes bacterium]|nr:6-bladed beta-propeller [Gemmatimonadota bacterium]